MRSYKSVLLHIITIDAVYLSCGTKMSEDTQRQILCVQISSLRKKARFNKNISNIKREEICFKKGCAVESENLKWHIFFSVFNKGKIKESDTLKNVSFLLGKN